MPTPDHNYPHPDYQDSAAKWPDPHTLGEDFLGTVQAQLQATQKEHEQQVALCHRLEGRVQLLSELKDAIAKTLMNADKRSAQVAADTEKVYPEISGGGVPTFHVPAGGDRFA